MGWIQAASHATQLWGIEVGSQVRWSPGTPSKRSSRRSMRASCLSSFHPLSTPTDLSLLSLLFICREQAQVLTGDAGPTEAFLQQQQKLLGG